jgi:glycerophosphoryl diester phosphodiesterase
LNFTKTYATGISPWKPLLFHTKELTQIIMVPQDINKDGKVDDADKTALSPMNLITEVHKIQGILYTFFRNEATACSVIIIMTF